MNFLGSSTLPCHPPPLCWRSTPPPRPAAGSVQVRIEQMLRIHILYSRTLSRSTCFRPTRVLGQPLHTVPDVVKPQASDFIRILNDDFNFKSPREICRENTPPSTECQTLNLATDSSRSFQSIPHTHTHTTHPHSPNTARTHTRSTHPHHTLSHNTPTLTKHRTHAHHTHAYHTYTHHTHTHAHYQRYQ